MPPSPAVSTNLPFSEGQPRLLRQRAEGLVGALQDALGADVDPRAGGHLTVHDQALGGQLVEMLLGGPMRHQVGVGDQHARGIGVGLEDRHRFAGLHQQGFIIFQVLAGSPEWRRRLPNCGLPVRARRRPPGPPGARPLRGRGCSGSCGKAASVSQDLQVSCVPRGARTVRGGDISTSRKRRKRVDRIISKKLRVFETLSFWWSWE